MATKITYLTNLCLGYGRRVSKEMQYVSLERYISGLSLSANSGSVKGYSLKLRPTLLS